MRSLPTVLALATLVAAAALVPPRVAAAQQPSRATPRSDSLTAQLVELELQGVTRSVGSVLFPNTPARDFSAPIGAIHAALRALPNGLAADQEATNRVALALDARVATLQSQLKELRLSYSDAHPAVRLAEEERRAVDRRLAEIRAAK